MTQRQKDAHLSAQTTKKLFAFKTIAMVFSILLLLTNILVFAQTMTLTNNMTTLEEEIKDLRTDNASLEKDLYSKYSLEQLNLIAEDLGFTKTAEPLFLENNEYALVQ